MTQPSPYQSQPQYSLQTYAPQQQDAAQPYAPQQYPQQQYPPQPYAPQQYPAQQYPQQQQAPQQYAPQQYPAQQPQSVPMVQCRFCGCVPAANVKFRGHQGLIVIMRFLSLDGPFCRDCGLSTFRRMTARTLVQGWYGYASLVITPITVLMNVVRRDKVANLPPPQAPPSGASRQPMDPGPPLLARPMAIIGLTIPFALLVILVALVVASNA